MQQPQPDTDLVVATPERVSFGYQVAGLGTRAIAQILDLLILAGVLLGLTFAAIAIGQAGLDVVAYLLALLGGFVVVFGYFWASEAFWSGQTVGKKVFRLRAVGDRGEPMTFMQAGIRNVVRIVDFLPYGYGVGLVVLFVNGKGKRLGDLAAGTIVVKDSDYIGLWQLAGGQAAPPSTPPPPSGAPPAPALPFAPATPAEVILRRLDPELRRFITSYARRRPELSVPMRAQLAGQVQPSLVAAVPDIFNQHGPLAALDYLADLERQ
ncbi:MAG: RDD family protein [Chloroflexi bacterium]|nr:MAG: RDD family protein [Chloroflexota bacterium]TMD73523.1 MAG: RDD family protein [Chloroflexota bacterium]